MGETSPSRNARLIKSYAHSAENSVFFTVASLHFYRRRVSHPIRHCATWYRTCVGNERANGRLVSAAKYRASFQCYKYSLIKGSRVTAVCVCVSRLSIFPPVTELFLVKSPARALFNEPKLERSIGTSNRKNASTKYIGRAVFCPFLRQIAPPYVSRFRFPIA